MEDDKLRPGNAIQQKINQEGLEKQEQERLKQEQERQKQRQFYARQAESRKELNNQLKDFNNRLETFAALVKAKYPNGIKKPADDRTKTGQCMQLRDNMFTSFLPRVTLFY